MKPSFLYRSPSNLRLAGLAHPELRAVSDPGYHLMTSGEILRMLKDTYDKHLKGVKSQAPAKCSPLPEARLPRRYQSQVQGFEGGL